MNVLNSCCMQMSDECVLKKCFFFVHSCNPNENDNLKDDDDDDSDEVISDNKPFQSPSVNGLNTVLNRKNEMESTKIVVYNIKE